MRVVYLDFDGVISVHGDYRIAQRVPKTASNIEKGISMMHPRLVANVDRLCRETGAVVVVSSSWRIAWPDDGLVAILRGAGLTVEVVGVTPRFPGEPRGAEIAADAKARGLSVEDFVILDDDSDMEPLERRWVQTFWGGLEPGFNEAALEKALGLFAADAAGGVYVE